MRERGMMEEREGNERKRWIRERDEIEGNKREGDERERQMGTRERDRWGERVRDEKERNSLPCINYEERIMHSARGWGGRWVIQEHGDGRDPRAFTTSPR